MGHYFFFLAKTEEQYLESRALLREYVALLRDYVALLREYVALLQEYRAFLQSYGALCGTLLLFPGEDRGAISRE